MAAVYEAHDPRLDRAVALKVLPPEFLHDDSFAARFEHEARVVARLDHPAIVPIFASGIDEGIPWMSMRLATGGSLASLLRCGRLAPFNAIGILSQVAAAIDHAHARGVTHRDIKPANILLDSNGHACVADFGLAQLFERHPALTSTGVLTGTPHYMAPEQALGKTTGPACDIYSLGIVSYEMIAGHTPFEADSPVAVLMKQVNEPLPDPDDDTMPAALLDVIRKAASKNPSDRWESAGAFIAAAQAAFEETPIQGTGHTRTAAHSNVRRDRLAATLSFTVLAAIGVTWYQTRHRQLPERTGSTVVEPALAALNSTPLTSDAVNVPAAAVAKAAPNPPRLAANPPEEAAPETVVPTPVASDTRAAEPAIPDVDSGLPNPVLELTPPTRVDASPAISAAESATASPQADTFTAPLRLKTIAPNYPVVARAGQIEGDVVVQASIDADGRVSAATVTRSVHPLLDEAARQAVLGYEYAPGRRNGVAESATVRIVVSFRLR